MMTNEIQFHDEIRNAYLQRRSVNQARLVEYRKIVDALGHTTWIAVQKLCQVRGLIAIAISQFNYLVKNFNRDEGFEYELGLVLESLRTDTHFNELLAEPAFSYILETNADTVNKTIDQLKENDTLIDKQINEYLGGEDSDIYASYLEYSRLGSEYASLKIRMNTAANNGLTGGPSTAFYC